MDDKRDYYRQKLATIRHRILNELETIAGELATEERLTAEASGELSSYDNHPADSATATFEQERDLGLDGRARFVLRMVDDALERLEAGDYGQCDSCETEISEARLEAMPYSTMCIDCKREWETTEKESTTRRPIEEEVLEEQLGGEFRLTDGSANNSYDGEDSWQDLARVGTSNTPGDILESQTIEDSYIAADEDRRAEN